jgi:hypothetical protein
VTLSVKAVGLVVENYSFFDQPVDFQYLPEFRKEISLEADAKDDKSLQRKPLNLVPPLFAKKDIRKYDFQPSPFLKVSLAKPSPSATILDGSEATAATDTTTPAALEQNRGTPNVVVVEGDPSPSASSVFIPREESFFVSIRFDNTDTASTQKSPYLSNNQQNLENLQRRHPQVGQALHLIHSIHSQTELHT